MKITNEQPRRYFAKHMVQGVAGYQDFNLYASNDAILKMEKSFEGKPLVVDHQDIDHDNLKNQMDGIVVRSFYNKWDGWHWAEIMAITDAAVDAIENKGWRVSNCYTPRVLDTEGTYLNVAYQQLLEDGEYDHLALVDNPRYEDSVVLTPSEFKAYNEHKESQFISNSKAKKPEGKRMFEFFKKVKIENDLNPEEMIVKLENGVEVSISEALDKLSNMADQTVVIEGQVFTYGELIANKEEEIKKEKKEKKENEEEEEEKEKENYKKNKDDEEDVENEDDEDDVENEDDEEEDKENEDDEEVDLENSMRALMNEGNFADTMDLINSKHENRRVITDMDRVELGKLKY